MVSWFHQTHLLRRAAEHGRWVASIGTHSHVELALLTAFMEEVPDDVP